eukprot:scaffold1046_cov189-Prasinococcus_capsulatus_cf.AAC.2
MSSQPRQRSVSSVVASTPASRLGVPCARKSSLRSSRRPPAPGGPPGAAATRPRQQRQQQQQRARTCWADAGAGGATRAGSSGPGRRRPPRPTYTRPRERARRRASRTIRSFVRACDRSADRSIDRSIDRSLTQPPARPAALMLARTTVVVCGLGRLLLLLRAPGGGDV